MDEVKSLCREKTVRKTCDTIVYIGHQLCIKHIIEHHGKLCDPINTCPSCQHVGREQWTSQGELLRKKINSFQGAKCRKTDHPLNMIKLGAFRKAFNNIRLTFPVRKRKSKLNVETPKKVRRTTELTTPKPSTNNETQAGNNEEETKNTSTDCDFQHDVHPQHFDIPPDIDHFEPLERPSSYSNNHVGKNKKQLPSSKPAAQGKPTLSLSSPSSFARSGPGYKIVRPPEKLPVPVRKTHRSSYGTSTFLDTNKFSKNPYEEFEQPKFAHNIPEESNVTLNLQAQGIRILNPYELDEKTKKLTEHKKLSDTRSTMLRLHTLALSVNSVDREIYYINKQNFELKTELSNVVKAYGDLHEDIRWGKIGKARQDQLNFLKFELAAAKTQNIEKDRQIALLKARLKSHGDNFDDDTNVASTKRTRNKSID